MAQEGAASSALVLLDYKYPILPLNPKFREGLALVSAIFAAVAGLGAHKFAKRSGRLILGWIFLAAALVVLVAIFWLSDEPSSLSRETTSLAARTAYVSLFVFLGGASGGFLRADEPRTRQKRSTDRYCGWQS
jgi:drug/metabolite transporter (DMT)-like permease